ncbi:thioredoxin-like protein [Lasiosphaeria miniovina]|uniref:Thioredoxin-like protein n=1 Tax=Lasiosphaeria miniovina TaxID=1954250 RepID=A0AA39ZQT6_9PEZI|nr:thioredoxin-like protein [Lasiosphaeria miniovina]KAK0701844.1 thioredoxin-like protein [Lasiosphaeria miniovina]
MRLFNFALIFGAAVLATEVPLGDDGEDEAPRENTYFNQKMVPPMQRLSADTWEQDRLASKWLMVKHFNPWCSHCIAFAPTFQTLYEFYYTSTPAGSGNENAKFTEFYDFRFGELDCTVYGDECSKHNVTTYPTTILYKDGETFKTFHGSKKNIAELSVEIEAALESTKPGTRPAKLDLPAPGDASTPGGPKVDVSSPSKDSTKTKEAAKADPSADAKADADAKAKAAAIAPYRAPPRKSKPQPTPNINGTSVPLSAETFQAKVTLTQEPWFIKFYAPWCHHCQAMAPHWEQMAKDMKGRLHVGEVNCDVESRLCKDVRLRGYPTILFFKGGERVEYDGLRGLGDFIQYADKAIDIASGVPDVDAASFKTLEAKEEVIFVYFYDHATTTEDFTALERLPLSLIGRAKLVKTQDPKLFEQYKITTWPRLIVSREGRPTYYTPLTPREMRDTHQVLTWMKSVWLPIVPELTASNAREIMDGKIVVLGILNRDDPDKFLKAQREMKSAANEWMDKQINAFQRERQDLRDAKQTRIEEAEDRGDQRALRAAKSIRINMDKADHKEVAFAWVDGIFWQRWIRTTYGIDVKDGDRVIINDEDNRQYWDQTITGNPINPSRTGILETILSVTASPPKIKSKLTISSIEKVFFDIRVTFSEHPYLSMGCILGVLFGLVSWYRGRMRRIRGGHFRLEENAREYKSPLLFRTNINGKAD